MKAALDYAVKLTRSPQQMAEADVQALRDAGWSDEDVMDIAEVTAWFGPSRHTHVALDDAIEQGAVLQPAGGGAGGRGLRSPERSPARPPPPWSPRKYVRAAIISAVAAP